MDCVVVEFHDTWTSFSTCLRSHTLGPPDLHLLLIYICIGVARQRQFVGTRITEQMSILNLVHNRLLGSLFGYTSPGVEFQSLAFHHFQWFQFFASVTNRRLKSDAIFFGSSRFEAYFFLYSLDISFRLYGLNIDRHLVRAENVLL